ncbi:pectin acetylesterase 8-like [Salvia splendens]|uniref:pectin acetylesterase 8-like n=1 Tax=Salvia splendens TaxID=180675 RepID=UPI001C2805F6|nr:pectin acetylesterase 8-like [Salvia splendens]
MLSFARFCLHKRTITVWLDGTPGAYFFSPGFENGIDNWIIYLPGGAWCNSKEECLKRSKYYPNTGTSKNALPKDFFTIMSHNKSSNPDFYNWNMVLI